MLDKLTELYCDVDDFVKDLHAKKEIAISVQVGGKKKGVKSKLSLSEVLTIIVAYHMSGFKNFKVYYFYLLEQRQADFPNLPSYNRFVELMSLALLPLTAYLLSRRGTMTGINFIDSTVLKVCKNKRISRNKVFRGIAKMGKSTVGWFFGLKLHLVVNEKVEILSFQITKGNVDDRKPVLDLCNKIKGLLFGDKGYISAELFEKLFSMGIKLVTGVKANMKNILMDAKEKVLLRKRSIIETINDQLKNISDIEHSRHRSPTNFLVNLIAGLVAYTFQSKRPTIKSPELALALK